MNQCSLAEVLCSLTRPCGSRGRGRLRISALAGYYCPSQLMENRDKAEAVRLDGVVSGAELQDLVVKAVFPFFLLRDPQGTWWGCSCNKVTSFLEGLWH